MGNNELLTQNDELFHIPFYPEPGYMKEHALLGMNAADFMGTFIRINSDLIVAGGIYHYPTGLGQTHYTKPTDHTPRTLTTPHDELSEGLKNVRQHYQEGNITSIALSFELNPKRFGRTTPFVASLLGIDVEAPVSEGMTRRIMDFCKQEWRPYVLFQAAERSYFLLLLNTMYIDNTWMAKEYIRFLEAFDQRMETWELFNDYHYGYVYTQDLQIDFGKLSEGLLAKTAHTGDGGQTASFDVRHFAHSTHTNTRTRANPDDTRIGSTFQFCMRVGEKMGNDEFRVVAASNQVPMRMENVYDGSLSMLP